MDLDSSGKTQKPHPIIVYYFDNNKKVFDVTLTIRFILDSFFLLISEVDKPPSCISSLPFVVNAIPYLPYISANLACVLGLAWQEFEGKVRERESSPDSALP